MNKKLIATLVMSSLAVSAFAVNAGAAVDKQVMKSETGAIHNVVGNLGKVAGATAEERALNALEKVKGDFGFAKAAGNFVLKTRHLDESGTSHTKMNQVIGGIPVFGNEMIVHENNGNLRGVTGTFKALQPTATKASLNSNAAIAKAVASTGFKGTLDKAATSELMYFPQGDKAVLAYKVGVSYSGDAPGYWDIFVNAVDGSIVNSLNKIEFTAAVGTGTGVLGDTKSINTNLKSGTYYLEDLTKPMYNASTGKGIIQTKDYRNGTFLVYNSTDTDNVWNTTAQRAAVDAHYYAGKVYDYYYNNLGRNSFDNAGGSLISYVHYSSNYNNAYWNGSVMTYGDGDGVTFISLSGDLDVDAHEISHGVTERESGLVYSNQSGALNESFSDIMGVSIQNTTWLVGDDIYTPGTAGDALRDVSNPPACGDPDNMANYVNTTADNGGVHTNSGIPNKAFYNFATAIGSRSVAAKIWYTANRDYWTSSTNFSGARAGVLQAVTALYGSGSSYYTAAANAWTAVGVN